MSDLRSEQLRRRKIDRLIEAIRGEMDPRRRKSLITTLAEEESKPDVGPPRSESVRRPIIERLIDLIYRETDPDSRAILVAILAVEEDDVEAVPLRRYQH